MNRDALVTKQSCGVSPTEDCSPTSTPSRVFCREGVRRGLVLCTGSRLLRRFEHLQLYLPRRTKEEVDEDFSQGEERRRKTLLQQNAVKDQEDQEPQRSWSFSASGMGFCCQNHGPERLPSEEETKLTELTSHPIENLPF